MLADVVFFCEQLFFLGLLKTIIRYNSELKVISFTNSTHPHINACVCTYRVHERSRIAVKTGIDVKAQSMTIRGKQRLPLASQSIAKAFWVTLVHTQTQGYTH